MILQYMKYRFGKTLVMHIFQGILIDYIVHLPCPEGFKKLDPAFALCAFKPGEQLIAYMGTVAVFSIMPCPVSSTFPTIAQGEGVG